MYVKLEDIPWMKYIAGVLPTKSSNENIWAKYDEILVRTESAANTIAYLIEMLYKADEKEVVVCIGYYDPEEDKRDGMVDECTGWWYVHIQ